jgi:Holliday junction resolvase RusA-like endonuclease
MKDVRFVVPGEPIAKGRPRSVLRNGHVMHYTPEKTARYENLVKLAAQEAMKGNPPCDGAAVLTAYAYFPIPKSWSLKKQEDAQRDLLFPTKRPDLDNIIKAVKDGMNGVVWRDDAQVVVIKTSKKYDFKPRVEIEVEFL